MSSVNFSAGDLRLSQVEQAAVLMMSLGRDAAVKVLRHLGPREVQNLSQAMTSVRQVHRGQLKSALVHFFEDVADSTGLGISSDDEVRDLLVDSLGEDRADALFDRIALHGDTRGLETLKWLDAATVADFVAREHPQIQAIVIAYLDASHAAAVMELLPLEQQRDIVTRVASLDSVQPLALEELNNLIESQFAGVASLPHRSVAGRKVLASVLKRIDAVHVDELLEGVRHEDQQLVNQLQSMMFSYDDLGQLGRKDLQLLLRNVSAEVLALALQGCELELRRKLLAGLGARALRRVRRALESAGAVSARDVEAARAELVRVARAMAEAGDIFIGESSSALVR